MINLVLAPEDVQKIIDALAAMPYREVHSLVPNIIQQANSSPVTNEQPKE